MHLKLPRPRLSLRSLAVLIAVVAVALWAGLNIWSPTRRLSHLLRRDQPVHIRRDPAWDMGRAIPFWEVDQAVSMLISALDDPSPRVRYYAADVLAELGPRADEAASRLITALNDEDLGVRCSAARALVLIVEAGSAKRTEAVTALTRTLDSPIQRIKPDQ